VKLLVCQEFLKNFIPAATIVRARVIMHTKGNIVFLIATPPLSVNISDTFLLQNTPCLMHLILKSLTSFHKTLAFLENHKGLKIWIFLDAF